MTVSDPGGSGVKAISLEYVWSQSLTAPGAGWTGFTSGGTLSLGSVTGTYYLWVRAEDEADNQAVVSSNSFILDNTPPNTPVSFTAQAGYGLNDLRWADGGGGTAGYLIARGPAGVAPSFSPSDGTSYSLGSQGADEIIFNASTHSMVDTELTTKMTYHYRLYAYDLAGNYSAAASLSSATVTPCAEGWVLVPGDPDYGTSDFCVMKYEAKNVGDVATSQAASSPWASISQTDVITKCSALGSGYQLITNDEWMTIAANIASMGDNWSGGSVGSGSLNRGHSDGSPGNALAASSDDNDACFDTGQTCSASSWNLQRRTFKLNTGEVIWDFAGNVWNSTSDYNPNGKATPATGNWTEYPLVGSGANTTKAMLVSINKSWWNDSWDSTQGIGQYIGGSNGSGGTLLRGGAWVHNTYAGVFTAFMMLEPWHEYADFGFRCVRRLSHLTPPDLALTAGDQEITASWKAEGGAAGYLLVRGKAGSYPSFTPQNGATYGVDFQGDDYIVANHSDLSALDIDLQNGLTYHYALYSYDGSNNYSFPSRAKKTPISCAMGFVLVPGDPDYGTSDFCVMKYEAKNVGGVATSQAAELPWVSISQTDSITQCQALGSGYQLISNDEWMTIGANIAGVGGNWSGGSVGSGLLNRGHSDGSPNNSLAASTDDNEACSGTGQTCSASSWDLQRRTFKLNTGEVIWDFSGNVRTWTSYYNPNGKATPATSSWTEYPSVGDGANTTKAILVPSNKSWWNGSWGSTQGIGQYYGGSNHSGGVLHRGGDWGNGTTAGVFMADLNHAPLNTATVIGFRCVQRHPDPNTPKAFVAEEASGSISLSWQAGSSPSTVGYLLVRGEAGQLPIFQPVNGSSYDTLSAAGNDTIVYDGDGFGTMESSLLPERTYHYHLFAYDIDYNYSRAALASVHLRCAANWVFVPGDADYGTSDFCVMKYEAKNVSNVATSQAASSPWVAISQTDAITRCSELGAGYQLISNNQWMTIAANIASVGDNWSGGSVDSGSLNRGHSDSAPNNSLAASADDNDACSGTGQTCSASTWDLQRRTLKLTTGEVIWDLAGNVWEWTSYYQPNGKATPATASLTQYPSVGSGANTTKAMLVPINKSWWNNTWDSTKGIGQYYAGSDDSGGALARGGLWYSGTTAGVFAAGMDRSSSNTHGDSGFRCASKP